MGLFDTKGERIVKEIAKLIESEEYKTAEANLETCGYKIGVEEQKTLRNKLEKAKSLSQFNKAVSGFNHKQAREALVALAGQVPSSQYAGLEARLKTIEDTDILSHLNSISYESQREETIRKFLDSNSESNERKEVIEYLLARRFVAIEDEFKNSRQEFGKLFNNLLNLNNLLERYQSEGAKLDSVVDIAKFSEMINEYLARKLVKKRTGEQIKVGRDVHFKSIAFISSYEYGYWTHRNNLIQLNSVGTVFWVQNNGDIYVQFEDLHKDSEMWGLLAEQYHALKPYADENKKVAAFKRRELQVVELYNEIEKNTVRKELTRMNEIFTQFYSGQKTEQEQVEPETSKPAINELVSQDFPRKTKLI